MATAEEIERAAAAVVAGALVVYPTETLYGLGADAADPSALARLLDLKGRDTAKGMSVLVTDLEQAGALLARAPANGAAALASRFWPGPLTLVLPAATGVPAVLVGAGGGVGLRCSTDPDANALLARSRRPLTATSANPSGEPAARSVEEARGYFGDRVAAYLDGGRRDQPAASTVVEFLGDTAYLRRAGAIPLASLQSVFAIERGE